MKNEILKTKNLNLFYGDTKAIDNCNISIEKNKVTAIIGPSGCGKSTLLRSLNRMNDLIEGCSLKGRILFENTDLYAPKIDPVEDLNGTGSLLDEDLKISEEIDLIEEDY